jgi:hypothetical protein
MLEMGILVKLVNLTRTALKQVRNMMKILVITSEASRQRGVKGRLVKFSF